MITEGASPSEIADVLVAQLSPQDLASVADLLLDRLTSDSETATAPAPAGM